MLGYLYRINCFLLVRTPTCINQLGEAAFKKKKAIKNPHTHSPYTAIVYHYKIVGILNIFRNWKTFCMDSFGLIFLCNVLLLSRMCQTIEYMRWDSYGIICTLHFRDYGNLKRLQYMVTTMVAGIDAHTLTIVLMHILYIDYVIVDFPARPTYFFFI